MARRNHQAVMERAAELFAQRQTTTLDIAEFEAWLDADPAHAVAYARVESAWDRSDRLKAVAAEVDDAKPGFAVDRRWAAGLLLAALGGGGLGWMVWPRSVEKTVLGERRVVSLEDGSRIELNTDSQVKVAYAADQRRIVLVRGEALFEVAKDPSRPFVVSANGAEIRAIGTAFNIRLREDVVELTVTEGVVAVDERPSAAGPKREAVRQVSEGGGAVIATGAVAEVALDAEVLRRRLAWRDGAIELEGETLDQAVAEFNRYNDRKLVIADPQVASIRVGGRFGVREVDRFLEAVQASFPVRAVPGEGGSTYLLQG